MESEKLAAFFKIAEEDNRVSTSHISLYAALLVVQSQSREEDSFRIRRRALMKLAKISGLATYHKCIRELAKYGYIVYLPSYKSSVQSRVRLVL